MRGYITRALSQYEGEKRTDLMREELANGPKVRNKREPTREWYCTVCKTWKRSFELVKVKSGLLMGVRIPNLQGRYIKACAQCAPILRRQV